MVWLVLDDITGLVEIPGKTHQWQSSTVSREQYGCSLTSQGQGLSSVTRGSYLECRGVCSLVVDKMDLFYQSLLSRRLHVSVYQPERER